MSLNNWIRLENPWVSENEKKWENTKSSISWEPKRISKVPSDQFWGTKCIPYSYGWVLV